MAKLSNFMKYELAQLEKQFMEKVHEYNAATFHTAFSQPCANCGKTFIGADWRLAHTDYCSEKCHRAHYGKLDLYTNHEIKLFWKFFGKDIRLMEDVYDPENYSSTRN